jgi:GNAT superfamily N-acetyltransferase
MKIVQATSIEDIAIARTLFEEYAQSLGFSLCFQNFDRELANLPGEYAPPTGRLLLLSNNEEVGGCIAFRRIDPTTCEMKRLFLRPEFRGKGLGRVLVEAAVQEARQLDYKRMRLDTVQGKMDDAIALYRSFGFHEIEPYYDTPLSETIFMELEL